MTVLWNAVPLNSAIAQAFKDAAIATAAALEATKPEHRIPIKGPVILDKGNRAIIRTGGLAPIFEKGAKPHAIYPKGVKTLRASKSKGQSVFKLRAVRGATSQVLKLADGNIVGYVTRHPGMQARPFIAPQVAQFPQRFALAGKLRLAATAGRSLTGALRGAA